MGDYKNRQKIEAMIDNLAEGNKPPKGVEEIVIDSKNRVYKVTNPDFSINETNKYILKIYQDPKAALREMDWIRFLSGFNDQSESLKIPSLLKEIRSKKTAAKAVNYIDGEDLGNYLASLDVEDQRDTLTKIAADYNRLIEYISERENEITERMLDCTDDDLTKNDIAHIIGVRDGDKSHVSIAKLLNKSMDDLKIQANRHFWSSYEEKKFKFLKDNLETIKPYMKKGDFEDLKGILRKDQTTLLMRFPKHEVEIIPIDFKVDNIRVDNKTGNAYFIDTESFFYGRPEYGKIHMLSTSDELKYGLGEELIDMLNLREITDDSVAFIRGRQRMEFKSHMFRLSDYVKRLQDPNRQKTRQQIEQKIKETAPKLLEILLSQPGFYILEKREREQRRESPFKEKKPFWKRLFGK